MPDGVGTQARSGTDVGARLGPMPTFLYRAELDPSKLDLREAIRPDHLAYQAELGNLAGGPLLGEDGAPSGSMIVFEAESFDAARDRVRSDPYTTAGVFSSWTLDRLDVKVWATTAGETA